MLVGVTSSLSHGITWSTTNSTEARDPPQHPIRPKGTYSNHKEPPKSPLKNGREPEAIASLKMGNLC